MEIPTSLQFSVAMLWFLFFAEIRGPFILMVASQEQDRPETKECAASIERRI